ncbi:hypothetical protein NXX40_18025 [Parabacteroides distasonis]|nr:hypothetical protein [Parabacteroides distasonis]
MRSYAFTVISHIVGIVLSTGLLFYCVHEEIIFCPTFLRDRDLVFLDSSLFHTDAAGEVLALCGGLLAAARLDPDRSFTLRG